MVVVVAVMYVMSGGHVPRQGGFAQGTRRGTNGIIDVDGWYYEDGCGRWSVDRKEGYSGIGNCRGEDWGWIWWELGGGMRVVVCVERGEAGRAVYQERGEITEVFGDQERSVGG